MKDFRNFNVWEKSHALALETYKLSRTFPKEELCGLTSQIRRACVSIPTNIAEGCGRSSDAELCRFVHISMGSACEFEYLLLLSKDINYIKADSYNQFHNDIVEIKKMLSSLIKKLKKAES